MIRIAVCCSKHTLCKQIKEEIELFQDRWEETCEILIYDTGTGLVEYLLGKNRIDLLFLSIEPAKREERDGIDIGILIRERLRDYRMKIVYVSCDPSHAMRLFSTEPMGFLIEPVQNEQIANVLQRFFRQKADRMENFVYKKGYGTDWVPYSAILYFQSMNHKIIIHTVNGQKEFYGKLKEVESTAPGYFIRIHKSFLVNGHFIRRFQYEKVILQNEQKLTISRSYRNRVQDRIQEQNLMP